MMTIQKAIDTYVAMENERQAVFLSFFGHAMTIMARDTYDFQDVGVKHPIRLRAINEIQHQVFSQIIGLLRRGEGSFPDDVIVKIMLIHDDAQLALDTRWAFGRALELSMV